MFAKLILVFVCVETGFAISVFTAVDDNELQHVSRLPSGETKNSLELMFEPEVGGLLWPYRAVWYDPWGLGRPGDPGVKFFSFDPLC